ncbi:hypothetical protein PMAYCL1PPCAC_12354, partial [Pristionchus mayeri]
MRCRWTGCEENRCRLIAHSTSLLRSRLDEGPVDLDDISEQFLLVHSLDGSDCLFLSLVLHQGVSLQVSRPSVQIQIQILDLSKLGKCIVHVLLSGLLVDVTHEDDPSLNGSLGTACSLVLVINNIVHDGFLAGTGLSDSTTLQNKNRDLLHVHVVDLDLGHLRLEQVF